MTTEYHAGFCDGFIAMMAAQTGHRDFYERLRDDFLTRKDGAVMEEKKDGAVMEEKKINAVLRAAKVLSLHWIDLRDKPPSITLHQLKQIEDYLEDVHRAICALYGVDPQRGFRMIGGERAPPAASGTGKEE